MKHSSSDAQPPSKFTRVPDRASRSEGSRELDTSDPSGLAASIIASLHGEKKEGDGLVAQLSADQTNSQGELAKYSSLLTSETEARLVVKLKAQEAESQAQDLWNWYSNQNRAFTYAIEEMELRAVDRYKLSPAFDAFIYHEYHNEMKAAHDFYSSKDRANERAISRLQGFMGVV
ncbi:hypothetical protein LWI29_037778 [Acer saccharum]|uniref:Uncharacterized protein n=1 Tax=Acer saccharum TaxID=4024 RepID=A0AA39VRD0_ACESA|nr:hypothetical protein LWI29_037778 [Acer saccharum]